MNCAFGTGGTKSGVSRASPRVLGLLWRRDYLEPLALWNSATAHDGLAHEGKAIRGAQRFVTALGDLLHLTVNR